MTEIEGVHHFGLTVTDLEKSAAWYCDVLGFEKTGDFQSAAGERRKVFLGHSNMTVRLGLVEHRTSSSERFDETRTGLDHLAFRVASRTQLEQWSDRLTRAGVVCSPIAESHSIPGAAVLVFRDPDNIQLEFFADPE